MAANSQAAAFIQAACTGDIDTASALLASFPSLTSDDFISACVAGDLQSVQAFLHQSPALAIQKSGPDHREPILYACFSRFLRADPQRADSIVQIVRHLLDLGADPNSHYIIHAENDPFIQTPLFGAAGIANNAQLTRMLLEAGADPNELTPEPDLATFKNLGTEALYHASEFSDTTCLELLLNARPRPAAVTYCLARNLDFDNPAGALLYLRHGADPNFRVPWFANRTHLQKAVMLGRDPVVIQEMIDRGADVNASDAYGHSAYQYAIRFGHPTLAKLLADHGANPATATVDDLLLCACVTGDGPRIGRLHLSTAHDVLCRAAQKNDVAALRRLLDQGADINAAGGQDHTPVLHWACWRGQYEAAKLLVERGADITLKNQYGGDALGTTIHGSFNCHDPEGGPSMKLPSEVLHGNYPAIVEMLIDAGATPPQVIRGGSKAVIKILLAHGSTMPAISPQAST